MRHPDIRIGLILLAVLTMLFVYSFYLPSPHMTVGVGPAFVPRLVLLAMMALTLLMMVQAGIKVRRGERPAVRRREGRKHHFGMLAALGFLLMMSYVGTYASVALYVAVTVIMAGGRRPPTVIAMALLVTLSVYLLFTKFLEVQFPAAWTF